MGIGRAGRAALLATALSLAFATAALAETRYAEPGGNGDEPCASSDPCSISAATGGLGAGDGDTILLNPGTYALAGGIGVPGLGAMRPAVPGTRPVITSTDGASISVFNQTVIEDLDIVVSNLNNAAALDLNSQAVARRVKIVVNGSNARAVQLTGFSALRDSFAWSKSDGGVGVFAGSGGGLVRNATAVASGTGGVGLDVDDIGSSTVSNTILRGTAFDLRVAADVSGVAIDHTAFATSSDPGSRVSAGEGNISAAPLFRAASTGDFHQCPGSPTINAGSTDDIGLTDIDGQARNQGGAPDIGADEFAGAPCLISVPPPPEETGKRAAALKKCKKLAKKKDWSKKQKKRCRAKARKLPL